jgi:hypothetical protein
MGGLPKVLRFWIVDINSSVWSNGFETVLERSSDVKTEKLECKNCLLRGVEIVDCGEEETALRCTGGV